MEFFIINLLITAVGFLVFSRVKITKRIICIWKGRKLHFNRRLSWGVCLAGFCLSFITTYLFFHKLVLSAAVSVIPAFIIYAAIDISEKFLQNKENGQITQLLMNMTKWSAIRNDIVFCLRKTHEAGIGKPLGTLIKHTLLRINRGMDIVNAIKLLEKESKSEDMRYLSKNIGFVASKGGNLHKLFGSMEQQFFKIEEELYKRKISTVRDRTAVYATVLLVSATAVWFLVSNQSACDFYINTDLGNYFLLLFSVIFSISVLVMIKR